jgi:hypothetical protein
MTTLQSQTGWELLHEVRLRGMIRTPDDSAGAELIASGHLIRRGAALVLTPQGRAVHAEWARLPAGSEQETAARQTYEQFLNVDKQVKQLTVDWQLASASAPTDGYSPDQWKLIDRLAAVDEKAAPMVSALGRAVPRFGRYRPLFRHALRQLEEGDRAWFSGVTCDSYHTVWWHLHEDLLLAVGVSRSDDPNQ